MNIEKLLEPSEGYKGKTVDVTGALLDEIQALSPGQVLKLGGREGRFVAVLDWEDLEHIMRQASMHSERHTGDSNGGNNG